ncbi:unnamed protein product [Rhizoctonia solani]|uniref:Laminin domain protein n=2 Tax=Rhizoctonia solani TaxID=456999 RepID=A0A8H3BJS0_9AGAM|nr:putative laminin domain protein [Rhizoctonia solani 123E]CAE6459445.1 unnamed protein product [Rhizoctonia solani]
MSGYLTNQVLSPPDLPPYLESVYKLKSIVGEPSDDEVIGIHAVIQVASKVVDVQGMGDPLLLFRLSEHLFNVQMTKYRTKYLQAVFPENTTYTPPALPAHVSNLESITGMPSAEAIIKVQNAIRGYQQFSNVPSMFDPRVNMDLSQHLFDLQMARYTQMANESSTVSPPQESVKPASPIPIVGRAVEVEESLSATNNAGTGATTANPPQTPQSTPFIDIRELLERSNQLADRFNQLLERSNELANRPVQPAEQPNSPTERFNQALERISQLIGHACKPAEQSNQLAERFNQLFDRFNQLAEQSNQSAQGANKLLEQIVPSSAADYRSAAQSNQPTERLGDILRNINGVLVGIQHAIVRNNKDNKIKALDCLVNDRGETPALSRIIAGNTIGWLTDRFSAETHLPVVINGALQLPSTPDLWLGDFLCFYGIGDHLREDACNPALKEGKEKEARELLSKYLSSCLG